MIRILLYILLTVSVAVFAQQQTDDGDESGNEIEQPADVDEDGENEPRDEPDLPVPSDSDFKPGEEISEDFPVPLPSDM